LYVYALDIESYVPTLLTAGKARTCEQCSMIWVLRSSPADLPYVFQSGLNILIGILFSRAYLSARESTPLHPPDVISIG
jgi:hypothetical protein